MSDVGAAILARLDAVEAVARAVTWHENGYSVFSYLRTEDGAHIALNEPAHVLRWVAAMRAVVAEHSPDRLGDCSTCMEEDIGYYENDDCGRVHYDPVRYPCPTIAALAAIWPDLPGDSDGAL